MAKYETRKVLTEKLSKMERQRDMYEQRYIKCCSEVIETKELLEKSREALTLVGETQAAHMKDLKDTIFRLQKADIDVY